eukprot:5921169-Amphidinium_carterae.1
MQKCACKNNVESRLCVMDNSTSELDMVAEFALTMKKMTTERESEEDTVIEDEKEERENEMYNGQNNDVFDNNGEEMQTLSIYKMEEGTLSMMNKMNIKLPSPTQFECRYSQFNEWSGEVKT